jgi:hypothetical protein
MSGLFAFMGLYSVTTETHRWLVIVRADSDLEAVMVAVLAMDGWEQDDEPVHVWIQHGNQDAAHRLGDREMIGWQLLGNAE